MKINLISGICLAALYTIWSSTYLGTYYALQSFPPFIILGSRFFLAGIILLVIAWSKYKKIPGFAELRNAAITGMLMMLGGTGLVTIAQQWMASGFAAVAVAAVPIWACLFSLIWGGKSNKYEWLGIGLGFLGIILLNATSLYGSMLGIILLILAPMSWAFGSILGRHLPLPKNLLMCVAWQQLFSGLGAFLISWHVDPAINWSLVSYQSMAGLSFLIFFGGIIAFSAYAYLLKHTRPALATSYAFVNPLIAVLLGVLIANEPFSLLLILALLIILGGVILIFLGQGKEPIAFQTDSDEALSLID